MVFIEKTNLNWSQCEFQIILREMFNEEVRCTFREEGSDINFIKYHDHRVYLKLDKMAVHTLDLTLQPILRWFKEYLPDIEGCVIV